MLLQQNVVKLLTKLKNVTLQWLAPSAMCVTAMSILLSQRYNSLIRRVNVSCAMLLDRDKQSEKKYFEFFAIVYL